MGLYTYLTGLHEQTQSRYRRIVRLMMDNEGVPEDLKRQLQWEWVETMNSLASRAEDIICEDMIYR